MEAARFEPFLAPEQSRFEKCRLLLGYWRRLRAELERPTRSDLDPLQMKTFLPNLLTGHIEPEPFRVLFRLVGTRIVEYSRLDFTNHYLDQLATSDRDDVDWHACYRYIHREHVPIIGSSGLIGKDGGIIDRYEYAIMPLWRGDDPAGAFVAIEVYDEIGPNLIADLNKVERRR